MSSKRITAIILAGLTVGGLFFFGYGLSLRYLFFLVGLATGMMLILSDIAYGISWYGGIKHQDQVFPLSQSVMSIIIVMAILFYGAFTSSFAIGTGFVFGLMIPYIPVAIDLARNKPVALYYGKEPLPATQRTILGFVMLGVLLFMIVTRLL